LRGSERVIDTVCMTVSLIAQQRPDCIVGRVSTPTSSPSLLPDRHWVTRLCDPALPRQPEPE
jgi:hypothetical protein